MKYDLKRDIADETLVALQWHGEDTKILIAGQGEKTEVAKGDIINVSLKQAKELLSYSHLWTLDGDKPTKHAYDTAMAKLAKKAKKSEPVEDEQEPETDKEIDLEEIDADKMNKKEIVSTLKRLGVSFNDRAGQDKLAILLKEEIEARKAAAETLKEGQESETDEDDQEVEDDKENENGETAE